MKRWKKVLLVILLVIFALLAALCIWQRENIRSLYVGLTKDETEILKDMEQNKHDLEDALAEHNITITGPNTEQSQALIDGSASADDVKNELGISNSGTNSGSVSEEDAVQTGGSSNQTGGQTSTSSTQEQVQKLINDCVSELYACEVDLMARLGVMKQEALDQWNSLSDEERTSDKMQEIGMDGLSKCYDLEVEIDGQVQNILSQYRADLKKLGADTGVLDTLWEYYCNEKASQKAYYINKYMK